VIFLLRYVSRVVFKGGILGGARQFWGNPYLNSATVLFDTLDIHSYAYILHSMILLLVVAGILVNLLTPFFAIRCFGWDFKLSIGQLEAAIAP